jgi:hypothetical protein
VDSNQALCCFFVFRSTDWGMSLPVTRSSPTEIFSRARQARGPIREFRLYWLSILYNRRRCRTSLQHHHHRWRGRNFWHPHESRVHWFLRCQEAVGTSSRPERSENEFVGEFNDVIGSATNYKVFYHTGTCHYERKLDGNGTSNGSKPYCNYDKMRQSGVSSTTE